MLKTDKPTRRPLRSLEEAGTDGRFMSMAEEESFSASALAGMIRLREFDAEAATDGIYLDAIRWTSTNEEGEEVPLEHLPRNSPGALATLKQSIEQRHAACGKGLLNPIEVRPTGQYVCLGDDPDARSSCGKLFDSDENGCPDHPMASLVPVVEGISGRRRCAAYRDLAGKHPWARRIPATIARAGSEELFLRALTENLERDDLTPVERANFMVRMMQHFGWNQAELAQRLGKSPGNVSRLVSVATKIAPEVQRELTRTGADAETAYLVSKQPDEQSQRRMLSRVAKLREEGEPNKQAARQAAREAGKTNVETGVRTYTARTVVTSRRFPGSEVIIVTHDNPRKRHTKQEVQNLLDRALAAVNQGQTAKPIEWHEP